MSNSPKASSNVAKSTRPPILLCHFVDIPHVTGRAFSAFMRHTCFVGRAALSRSNGPLSLRVQYTLCITTVVSDHYLVTIIAPICQSHARVPITSHSSKRMQFEAVVPRRILMTKSSHYSHMCGDDGRQDRRRRKLPYVRLEE